MLDGIDDQLDQMGILLSKDIVCGDCLKKMQNSNSKLKCPSCGAEFTNNN